VSQAPRHDRLDALKGFVTLLVVFHHTAITYGGSGSWFYVERRPDGSLPSLLLTIFCTVNQAWFMGFFFLLAGRFTPQALERKGAGRFLIDRAVRLGVPWLVFGLLLGPLTIALARTARGQDFFRTLGDLLARGSFEPGPLWFAQALLLMALLAAIRHVAAAPQGQRAAPLPSTRALLAAAVAVGLVAFFLRLLWPVGTEVWHLQLGYFASYGMLFWAGIKAGESAWFEQWPAHQVKRWRRIALLTLPCLLPLALLPEQLPLLRPAPTGGWNLPSLMYALWEPFVAWGVLMALVSWALKPGPVPGGGLSERLARCAFGIYVLHPLAVVAVALAWRGVDAPALLKWGVTGAAACVLSFAATELLLRLPGIRRFL
jgi:Acyltransferase family